MEMMVNKWFDGFWDLRPCAIALVKKQFHTRARFGGWLIAANLIINGSEGPFIESWFVGAVTGGANSIGGGLTVEIELRKHFSDTLWHLGNNVFMLRSNCTHASEGKIQYYINETHDKISVIAADINDDTAENTEENSHLGNHIIFSYQGVKMMFWSVCQLGKLSAVALITHRLDAPPVQYRLREAIEHPVLLDGFQGEECT